MHPLQVSRPVLVHPLLPHPPLHQPQRPCSGRALCQPPPRTPHLLLPPLPLPPHPSLLHNYTEQIFDPVDDLHRSLKELKHFRKSTFQLQMSNIQTWVSAAMTHDDTLNSLGLLHDPVVGKIKCKINRVAWVTNNALYMISHLCHSRRIHNSDPTD